MNGLNFATPAALVLLPVPLLMLVLSAGRPTSSSGLWLPASIRDRLLREGAGKVGAGSFSQSSWQLAAAGLAWIGLIVALAGPRMAGAVVALPAAGRDIMLVLDLSGSMTQMDFALDGVPASRLDVLKQIGSELIRRREGDRIGLIVFAETAFAAAPLSFDVRAVARTLNEMEIGLVGRSTAIGAGLGLALKRLADSTAPSRVVILLSDGANNAGSSDPAAVARLARELGAKVYTIGFGVDDRSARSNDPEAVDFEALRHVAEIGGGAAFRARTGAELDEALRAIEALEAGPAPAPPAIIFRDLWIYPAVFAFTVLAAIALSARSRR